MASEYRLRRGPVLGLLVIIGVVGTLLIARSSTRPGVDASGDVAVPAAYVGTTYAVDGLVCLQARGVEATVTKISDGTGSVPTLLRGRPPGAPVAVAYPVAPDAGTSLVGLRIAAGDEECVRALVRPSAQGDQHAAPVTVRFRYGPFGLLRAGVTVTPSVLLHVVGTGPDPRAGPASTG